MSKDDKEHADPDFDVRLWLCELRISEPGLQKLAKNEVSDEKCLLQLTPSDIVDLKLGVGDKRRLVDGLDVLRNPQGTPSTVSSVPPAADSSGSSTEQVDGDSSTPLIVNQVGPKTSFTVDEVANFLAGTQVPANVQASISNQQNRQVQSTVNPMLRPPLPQQFQTVPQQQGYDVNRPFLPTSQYSNLYGQSPLQPPLQSPLQPPPFCFGQQNISPYQNYSLYARNQSYSAQGYPNVNNFGSSSTIPVYQPQRPTFVPSRSSSLPSSRDPRLQQRVDGYQNSGLNDLWNINEYNPAISQGEPLYLPCNFVSHVRGSARADDEELFHSPAGTKIYIANGPKKVQPEKLSYGLFFGANARILARLIPNVTPDLADYLDYLRKIGDLMLNYTTSSVFLLDHEHRFEVLENRELGKRFNSIDQALCMNVLKKREVPVTPSTSGTVSRLSSGSNSSNFSGPSQQRTARRTTVICYLFNQQDGCPFTPNCRFLHVCNVVGCGLEHPAFKHNFRGQGSQSAVPAIQPANSGQK